MTKIGFVSLGCPKNLVDSEVMMGILAREGYELTPRADEAEVLVVNTCSFIEAAQKESVDAILEMAEHKRFGAAKKLIAEGCDHPCTFCIIPELRGAFRSRRFESVVREAENLARAGAREITLIGQDTTSYGEDFGVRDGLAQLLEKLARVEDLLWVRFLYAYPNRVTQKLLDTIAAHPRLAKYMDMPLQHASRSVLARMKRGSNGDAFLKLLERIRTTIPGVSLRTSFIVGFPGETEDDFKELCDFVKAANFDWLGVFEYSDVDNAESFALDKKVDAETIAGRRNRLMAIQRKISRTNLREKYLSERPRARKSRTFTALIEGPSKDTSLVWEARLEGMAPEIDGKLYLTDVEVPGGEAAAPGDVACVEITKSDAYDLIGRVVEILPRSTARASDAADSIPPALPAEKLHRIATGAPLRVLG